MKAFFRAAICGVLLSLGYSAQAQTVIPSDRCAVTAFNQQREQFFLAIPASALQDLGMASQAELKSLVAGAPYLTYTVQPAVVVQNTQSEDPEQMLEPTGTWYVPLRSGPNLRLLALVQHTQDGRCKLVSLGYSGLADGLSNLFNSKGLSVAERHGRLVQIPQALETLWVDGAGEGMRAVRLSQWAIGSTEKRLAAGVLARGERLTEVFRQLGPMVTRNLNER